MKLSKNNSHLLDIALNKGGFEFHHTKPDHIMLTKWLPKTDPNKLPGYASHYIGVGGLVLSKDK